MALSESDSAAQLAPVNDVGAGHSVVELFLVQVARDRLDLVEVDVHLDVARTDRDEQPAPATFPPVGLRAVARNCFFETLAHGCTAGRLLDARAAQR